MSQKEMTITIMKDGTIKTETGDMSGIAHNTVDQFMKKVGQGLGSEPEIEKLKHVHSHTHTHTHEQKRILQ